MEDTGLMLKHAVETYEKIVEMREEFETFSGAWNQYTAKNLNRAIRALQNAEDTFAPFMLDYIRYNGLK